MQIDTRSLTPGALIQTDVCIVGAGTAGIVLARELIGQAFRVCLLESGGPTPDPKTQSLAFGENVGFPYYPLDTARARYLGGSSTRWHVPMGGERLGARLRPFDAIDFEARDWVAYSGWPFSKAHLDPFYERAQTICGIQPATFAVEDWEDARERPRLPLAKDQVDTIIYKIGSRDLFVRDYVNEIGRGDNIQVYLYANVLEVMTNSVADCVTELRVRTIAGNECTVRAKVFVLANGGIEVPRLLLLSNAVQKTGLGNQHDLVGRFFMEHPHFWSGLLVPSNPEVLSKTALYNQIHTVRGVSIVGKLAPTESALRKEKLLNQNIQLIPHRMPDPFQYRRPRPPAVEACRALLASVRRGDLRTSGRHVSTILHGLDEIAASGTRKVRDGLLGIPEIPLFIFANMMEQVPNPASRVTLGRDRDLFGQARVQLNWKITPQDVRSAKRTLSLISGALENAGIGRYFHELNGDSPPANTEGGYHHMGTTRMHADPKQGVVDADCTVHGLANLFIAGPSVFPTGGYANPVLTMIALTVRLADHLKSRLATL